jgi:hypothetical protein
MRGRALSVLVLLCAGCTTVTPAHEEGLAEVQSFADEVTRVYQFPPIRIVPRDASVMYREIRMIGLTPQWLIAPPPLRDVHVALGLAAWVVNTPTPVSRASETQINQRAYPEMNIATVDILTRVKGLPERVAVRLVYDYLVGLAEKQKSPSVRGVPLACEQILSFALSFPKYQFDAAPPCP